MVEYKGLNEKDLKVIQIKLQINYQLQVWKSK